MSTCTMTEVEQPDLHVTKGEEPAMDDLMKTDSMPANQEVLGPFQGKVLHINDSTSNIEFRGLLDKVFQYVNMAEVLDRIQKGAEYVVQIPAEYQEGVDAGLYWIMENAKTGKQLPTLMTVGADGKKQIVTPLPVKKREFIRGDPIREVTDHYHNLYLQQQINELSGLIETTLDAVKRIEHGQMDDRIALLNAGRQGIILALAQKDELSRPTAMLNAINNINIAQNQIAETFKRRVAEFEPLPKSTVMQFLKELTKTGYLDSKDEEYGEILEYYELYLQATQMLAGAYTIMGDKDNARRIFDISISQMNSIDFSKLKTIEYTHKDKSFAKIYENAAGFLLSEKQVCLDTAQEYECLSISVSGEKLLEVLEDGAISKEKAE